MKKFMAWMIAALIALCPIGMAEGNWYVAESMQLAERIVELAREEAYAQMFVSGASILETVKEFAESDFSDAEVRMISLPDEKAMKNVMKVMDAIGGEGMPEMSQVAEKEFFRRMVPAFVSTVIGHFYGDSWLMAASILRTSETYIMPDGYQNSILLLEYPGGYSVAVTFTQTGEQTVTAEATALPSLSVDEMPFLAKTTLNMLFPKVDLQ